MKQFFRDQRGANLVEYIVLVGVVALLSIAAFRQFGYKVRGKTDSHSEAVQSKIVNQLRRTPHAARRAHGGDRDEAAPQTGGVGHGLTGEGQRAVRW